MAKLTGAKKKAFLERMERGRRKAARAKGNPKRKAAAKKKPATKKKRAAAKKKTAKRAAPRKNGRLAGKAKAEFLRRMARGRKKAAQNPKRKPRRNSEDGLDAAAAKFSEFHGKPPERIIEYEQGFRYHENYAEMGQLRELRFFLDDANPDFPLTRFGECQAVTTPDGRNIYFIGGDQAIDLAALDIASDKDMIELGPCTYIAYYTVKGFHDFRPILYYHQFGEEDGIFPRLAYDRMNKTLFLLGGNYTVRPEGIVN